MTEASTRANVDAGLDVADVNGDMSRTRRIQTACASSIFDKIYKTVKSFIKTFTTEYDSNFYYAWLWVISAAVLYNILVIPLRASFVSVNEDHLFAWLWLDYVFADVIYLMDMFVRMRTTFYQQGENIVDVKLLRQRYMHSWQFIYDVASILPTDIIYAGVGMSYYTIVRVNRLVRVSRFFEMTSRVESVTSFPNIFRMATTIFGVLLALHFTAIFYHSYSKAYGFGTNEDDMCNFQLSLEQAQRPFFPLYMHCFYWATMTLCFIGEMPPPSRHVPHQMIIQVCLWLTGLMMFGAIVGRIALILNNVGTASNTFQRQIDTVRIYLNLQKVSSDLYVKVILWFNYAFENRVIGGEEKVLKPLPEKMKTEIASDMHLATLRRVQLFADLDTNVLSDLVTSFRLQVFSPNDYVCKKGDIGREMYVVKRGTLQVVSDDGEKVFVTLGAGSVFGEISLLNIPGSKTGNKRTANVRSRGYSDLFSLSKDDLYRCLQEYPDAMKKLVEKGIEILRKENKIDEDAIVNKQKAEEILKKRVKTISEAIEDAETRFARLIADMAASRTAAIRRIELLEQRLNLPPIIVESDDGQLKSSESIRAMPSTLPQTPSGVLVRGLGAIPTVQLLPATPIHTDT